MLYQSDIVKSHGGIKMIKKIIVGIAIFFGLALLGNCVGEGNSSIPTRTVSCSNFVTGQNTVFSVRTDTAPNRLFTGGAGSQRSLINRNMLESEAIRLIHSEGYICR